MIENPAKAYRSIKKSRLFVTGKSISYNVIIECVCKWVPCDSGTLRPQVADGGLL